MMAMVRDTILAASDDTVNSSQIAVCPWTGTASCDDVVVDGETHAQAAWFHPDPEDAARRIAGRWPSGRA